MQTDEPKLWIMKRYVIFLRGINVGGHHKVPMAELRSALEKMKFHNCTTILNSGNVLGETDENVSEEKISELLELEFGFPIPTLIRTFEMIDRVFVDAPFKTIALTKDTRLYVTFLKNDRDAAIALPWKSPDGAYRILEKRDRMIFSVLDLSLSQTPKAMEVLEQFYGREATTRNWNTIERIVKKARSH